MAWVVEFHDEFEAEFEALSEDVQDNLLAAAKAVQIAGPKAGRPHVDTLSGSKHKNMKELRFEAGRGAEAWRVAFAFDTERHAIVLAAGASRAWIRSGSTSGSLPRQTRDSIRISR